MKILINTTPPTNKGGVANHYKGLKKYWSEDVHYNYIGGRKGIPGPVILVFDLIKFIYKCVVINPDLVVLNPSLAKTALQRDALYLKVGKLLNKKTVLFFHGWKEELEETISDNPDSFVKKFNRTDAFLVLSSSFREKLKKWGISKPVFLTTTKIDDELVRDFRIQEKKYEKTILYLARVERKKGIFITLKAYKEIKKGIPGARLIIAGTGSALPEVKEWVEEEEINDVEFKGYVIGNNLKNAFKQADLYILPSHTEGMPTSVLEAMAFGLPVVSRPVGGLPDFFENDKMGYLIQSLDSSEFARKLMQLLENPAKIKEISIYNHHYAQKNFLASNVARNLEQICNEILTPNLNK